MPWLLVLIVIKIQGLKKLTATIQISKTWVKKTEKEDIQERLVIQRQTRIRRNRRLRKSESFTIMPSYSTLSLRTMKILYISRFPSRTLTAKSFLRSWTEKNR